MRNPRILNRRMFNPNVSAYGRGIASNLVSEEERIRFNAGGRVGLKYGSELVMKLPFAKKIAKWGAGKFPKKYNPAQWWSKIESKTTAPGFGAKDIGTLKAITGAGSARVCVISAIKILRVFLLCLRCYILVSYIHLLF